MAFKSITTVFMRIYHKLLSTYVDCWRLYVLYVNINIQFFFSISLLLFKNYQCTARVSVNIYFESVFDY